MENKIECCVIKGQYPHKCDMLGCAKTVCDICGLRVIHECASKRQLRWLRSVTESRGMGTQFLEVCYNHALEVVKHGISVERFERKSRVFVTVEKRVLIDKYGNLG